MSLNKVMLIGNVGKDPDLLYTASGQAVTSFPFATTEKFKNKGGEIQERTEWHNIVAWGPLAEICGKYLVKGRRVYLEGRLQNRSYDDRNGNKRYVSEIVISDMKMLGGPSLGDSGGERSPRQIHAKPVVSPKPIDVSEEQPFDSD